MNRPNSCLFVRFSCIVCYSLPVLDFAFGDYFVLQFICACAFVMLDLVQYYAEDWLGRTSPT